MRFIAYDARALKREVDHLVKLVDAGESLEMIERQYKNVQYWQGKFESRIVYETNKTIHI